MVSRERIHFWIWFPVILLVLLGLLFYAGIGMSERGIFLKTIDLILKLFIGSEAAIRFWLIVLCLYFIYQFMRCRELRSKGAGIGIYVSWVCSLVISVCLCLGGMIVLVAFSNLA